MKNKIDPRQYTPYALNTPSGNLSFVENVDSFSCYLLEGLTGNYDITGSLKVNNIDIYLMDASNNRGGTNSEIFGGLGNTVTGSNNFIIASSTSQISGEGNLILGGQGSLVADADYGAALFGRNTIVGHTGAVIIGDSDNLRDKHTQGTDSFTLDFTGGNFIQNNLFLNGEVRATGGDVFIDGYSLDITGGNLTVSDADSGMFLGDIQVMGEIYHTGSPVQDFRDMLEHSGSLQDNMNTLHSFSVNTTGSQFVTGTKTFTDEVVFYQDLQLNDSGKMYSTTGQTNLYLNNNDDFWSGNAFYLEADNSASILINRTGGHLDIDTGNLASFNETSLFEAHSFSILGNTQVLASADLLFGVNASGDALFNRTIKMSENRFVPESGTAHGVSGQMSWDENFLYVCTGVTGWARVVLTGW